jgi:uncharacterized protein YebE (UPF0316 family)
MGFDVYAWIVVPLLIFSARIVDVSLGTLRFIYLSRGYKKVAPLLGFFEILVWLLAIRGVLVNLTNWACFFAYAAGFAMGNYVGMWLEEKLSLGMVLLRVVFSKNSDGFMEYLRKNDFGFTLVKGEGSREKRVRILFTVQKRKDLREVLTTLEANHSHAFYTVENIRSVHQGIFPYIEKSPFHFLFRKYRKGK